LFERIDFSGFIASVQKLSHDETLCQAPYRAFASFLNSLDLPPIQKRQPRQMNAYSSIEWRDGTLRLLDQRQLPHRTEYLDYIDYREIPEAIRSMVVRGAPAIGITGAYGLALCALGTNQPDANALLEKLRAAQTLIHDSRPTAVNLAWALERVMKCAEAAANDGAEAIQTAIVKEANSIFAEDLKVNRRIGEVAMELVPQTATIVHHCNTGSLATAGYGTALGVIRTAHESGREVLAILDETRPRLQGAALSSWELLQLDIPHRVIVDGASGHVMRTRGVDLCVVGCDRVAANGDTANKIGTYNLALVARAHNVPFYVAAPTNTIDMNVADGDAIPIEERDEIEVFRVGSERIAPEGARAFNPAFDVTPAQFITAFITEKGIVRPPFDDNLRALFE
jgi:methylthioribose-1-phosphate isomerase